MVIRYNVFVIQLKMLVTKAKNIYKCNVFTLSRLNILYGKRWKSCMFILKRLLGVFYEHFLVVECIMIDTN